MMNPYEILPIGQTEILNGEYCLVLKPEYRKGLPGLDKFGHAIALWWAHQAGQAERCGNLILKQPYTVSTEDFGVFATRSPTRPNPIGLSVFSISRIDLDKGIIFTPYIDTMAETPLLDIKPYFPASDRVAGTRVPDHFRHWPDSVEESARFDWSDQFT